MHYRRTPSHRLSRLTEVTRRLQLATVAPVRPGAAEAPLPLNLASSPPVQRDKRQRQGKGNASQGFIHNYHYHHGSQTLSSFPEFSCSGALATLSVRCQLVIVTNSAALALRGPSLAPRNRGISRSSTYPRLCPTSSQSCSPAMTLSPVRP